MINVSELVTDPDFCQPEGIQITRFKNSVVNHRTVEIPQNITVQGIIVALDSNEDDMLPEQDRNKEVITILTKDRLKTVGIDKVDGQYYGSDIVNYNGSKYIVRYCQDHKQYGYCRSKATKIETEVE